MKLFIYNWKLSDINLRFTLVWHVPWLSEALRALALFTAFCIQNDTAAKPLGKA